MSVGSGDMNSVVLLPSNATLKQSLDMTLFTVTQYVLLNASVLKTPSLKRILPE